MIVSAIIAWAVTLAWIKVQVQTHKNSISSLWEKKSDVNSCAEQKVKIDGIDRWTREYERESNAIRLKVAERFSSLEKSVEIGMTNHTQMIQFVGRLDNSLVKLEERFEVFTTRLEKILLELSQGGKR
jgi:hypothetical protein